MIVKICGLRRHGDLELCAELGVDWVGINLWPGSKRYVEDPLATQLAIRARRLGLVPVALLVEASPEVLSETWRSGLWDWLQVYAPTGSVPSGIEWIRPRAVTDHLPSADDGAGAEVDLWETRVTGYGGAGRSFDWSLLAGAAPSRPTLVGGGIRPDNVSDLLRVWRPWGIDVASGSESAPGVKDRDKIRTLMEVVRDTAATAAEPRNE